VDEIAETHPGGAVVVVAHGGVINAYLADLLELHRSFFITVENTSVTLVRARPGSSAGESRVVVTVNDCHHLYDPILAVPAVT
jgi:broad specificity phosphatase PhoE